MDAAKDRQLHPARLKQLGRHASYATLAYLEAGLFEDNGFNGVLNRAGSSRRSAAQPSHRISPTGMRRPGNADASSASVGPWLVTAV
jgi:hypothetical protein